MKHRSRSATAELLVSNIIGWLCLQLKCRSEVAP